MSKARDYTRRHRHHHHKEKHPNTSSRKTVNSWPQGHETRHRHSVATTTTNASKSQPVCITKSLDFEYSIDGTAMAGEIVSPQDPVEALSRAVNVGAMNHQGRLGVVCNQGTSEVHVRVTWIQCTASNM